MVRKSIISAVALSASLWVAVPAIAFVDTAPADVPQLAMRVAQGDQQAQATLVAMAQKGDPAAQSALMALQQRAAQSNVATEAVAKPSVQALAMKAAQGDSQAQQTLVTMAKQGDPAAQMALQALSARTAGTTIKTPAVASAAPSKTKPKAAASKEAVSAKPSVRQLAMQTAQGDKEAQMILMGMAQSGDVEARMALSALAARAPAPGDNTAAPEVTAAQSQELLSNLMSPRMVALMPPGVMDNIIKMSQMEKDPNMEDEFNHLLYWMGEYRRCTVRQSGRGVSVLGVMVMLDKAYGQFKPVLPNLESLLMMASIPRDPTKTGEADPITLHCRKKDPIAMLEWVMPELYRYRAKQASSVARR